MSKVIRIDEGEIRTHLDEMVRGTVEETLNQMLDAEADEMCRVQCGLKGVRLIISDACIGLSEAAASKAQDVIEKLKAMKLGAAAEQVDTSINETLTYYAYPPQHWLKLKTNNPMERLLKEARRPHQGRGCFRNSAQDN